MGQRSKPSFGRRALNALKRAGLFAVAAVVGFYHLFDRFRTSQSRKIVTDTLLAGALILLLASVLMLCKPSLDASRAVTQAKSGNAARALQLLSRAENGGLGASKLDKARLKMASAFTEGGNFTAARQLLAEVSESAKAQAQSEKTNYAEALSLYEAGSFQSAAQLFYRLGTYADSTEKYRDCLCAIAVQAYLDGGEARARSLLAELDDAESRLWRVLAYLGHSELASEALFSGESLAHMRESYALLRAGRQSSQKGLIAAGARHSLVLRENGTVLAGGDNLSGQCNTGSWSGIRMVAAGKYHSVGLKQDGTVLACGDNTEGQCNVSAWQDIVSVAAGAYTTVGLKRDGSVVACGKNAEAVSGWREAESVSAGSYSIGALTRNGSMLASHASALLPVDVKMFETAVCGAVSAGILYDGSLICSWEKAPAWTGLKSVALSETGIYAVTLSGEVKAQAYRSADSLNINVSSGALEIAASGTHALVLMNDGRVLAYGDNSYGQCGVHNTTR